MSEQNDIGRYRIFFLDSRRDYVNSFNQTVDKFIKQHLILNAGAASVLAIYFLQNGQEILYLQYSVLFFLLGSIFSIFAVLFDFFWAYFSLDSFDKNFFCADEQDVRILKHQYERYENYQKDNKSKINFTIQLRIFNGILSYICFLVGIFVIIFNKTCPILNVYFWLVPIVILYGIVSVFIIKKCIKPVK